MVHTGRRAIDAPRKLHPLTPTGGLLSYGLSASQVVTYARCGTTGALCSVPLQAAEHPFIMNRIDVRSALHRQLPGQH